jgi:hypothetical protein
MPSAGKSATSDAPPVSALHAATIAAHIATTARVLTNALIHISYRNRAIATAIR